jgi:hypothetical protein
MARDTDRKVVSEALRLIAGTWSAHWGIDYQERPLLVLIDAATNELDITYSAAGRIVHVAHWSVVEGTNGCASRQPIERRKRDRVLAIIKGAVTPGAS